MYRTSLAVALATIAFSTSTALGQDTSARTVQYHSQDIVPIHAKLKYTTLIEVPPTEKIMEAATGDKDFWVVDVVGNFCFVHPAKAGISSNLNLITHGCDALYFLDPLAGVGLVFIEIDGPGKGGDPILDSDLDVLKLLLIEFGSNSCSRRALIFHKCRRGARARPGKRCLGKTEEGSDNQSGEGYPAGITSGNHV